MNGRNGQTGRGARAARLAGGAAFVLLVLCVATAVVAPRDTAAFLIRKALHILGAEPVSFEVAQSRWGGLVVENVAAGADGSVRAARVALEFGPLGPLGGVASAAVKGLRVTRTLGAGGGGPLTLPKLPVAFPLTLEDSAVALTASGAVYSASAPGIVTLSRNGIAGAIDLALKPAAQGPGARGTDARGTGAFMPHRGTLSLAGGGRAPALVTLALAPVGAVAPGSAHISIAARLESIPGSSTARLTLGAKDVALPASGLALQSFALSGNVVATEARIALSLDDCARIEGLTLARLAADLLPLCTDPQSRPALSLALGGAEDEALSFDVAVSGARLRYLSASGAVLVSGTGPETLLSGTADLALSRWSAVASAAGGDLHGPSGVVLSDMSATAEAEAAGGRVTVIEATLAKAMLSDPAPKPVIVPLTLTASAHTQGRKVGLQANAAASGLPALLHAEGSHDLDSGAGSAALALAPLLFDPAGLTMQALFPALAAQASEVRGKVGAEGHFAWGAQGLTSQGALHLEKLAARMPFGRFDGLDGTINFASLAPLMTAAPQTLHARLLDIGLPLTDGQISLSVENASDLRIHDAHWSWLGGTVGLASALLSPFRSAQALTFAVDKVDLQQLLALADVKGLSGTGRISGRIPVTLEGGRQPVQNGQLSADPPGGTLIYKTGQATGNPASPSAVLYTALDNFQYDALTADVTGDLAGTLSLQVHLKGRNPDLYDGRRIELNVSTEGAFVDMLRKGLGAYRRGATP